MVTGHYHLLLLGATAVPGLCVGVLLKGVGSVPLLGLLHLWRTLQQEQPQKQGSGPADAKFAAFPLRAVLKCAHTGTMAALHTCVDTQVTHRPRWLEPCLQDVLDHVTSTVSIATAAVDGCTLPYEVVPRALTWQLLSYITAPPDSLSAGSFLLCPGQLAATCHSG